MNLIGLQCTKCRLYLRISEKSPGDSAYVLMEEIFGGDRPCPDCQAEMLPRFNENVQGGPFNVVNVTLQELWLSLNGRGTPEQLATEARVRSLFEQAGAEAETSVSPSGHTRIHSILFSSGERLHLAVSGGYAAAYRITGGSYARESSQLRNEERERHQGEDTARSEGSPDAGDAVC